MNAATVINTAIAAFLRLCRTRRRPVVTVWDFTAHTWTTLPPGTQPGPNQMTARDIATADPLELLWLTPAYDRDLAAGCDRLRQAVRDEQQNGDQT